MPDTGEKFLSWSGDAGGSQNPLTVTMSQSKVITANFSSAAFLRANAPGLEGMTPQGFRLTVISDPSLIWQLFASSNLNNWEFIGTVTNEEGAVQFTDPGALTLPRRFYRAVLQ